MAYIETNTQSRPKIIFKDADSLGENKSKSVSRKGLSPWP